MLQALILSGVFALIIFINFEVVLADSYYVTPTSSSSCPNNNMPCFTIDEYASKSVSNPHFLDNTSLSLVFLPGEHFLDSELSLRNFTTLSLKGVSDGVEITCSFLSVLKIEHVTHFEVGELTFIECFSLQVYSVETLVFRSCSFQGGVGLNLTVIASGDILGSHLSSFNYKSMQSLRKFTNQSGIFYIQSSNISITESIIEGITVENVNIVAIWNSSIAVENCKFANNVVKVKDKNGGVLSHYASFVTIDNSLFDNNTCAGEYSIGCALFSSESTISITDSKFLEHKTHGGVLYCELSKINISNCVFTNNHCGHTVIFVINSTVDAANCRILNNTDDQVRLSAGLSAGMCFMSSSVTLQNGLIAYNKVNNRYYLGAAVIIDKSTAAINNYTLTHNKRVITSLGFGSALIVTRSKVVISNSMFTKNNIISNRYSNYLYQVDTTTGGSTMDVSNSIAVINNCTFSFNDVNIHISITKLNVSATVTSRGSIVVLGSVVTMKNIIITGNKLSTSFDIKNVTQVNETIMAHGSGGGVIAVGSIISIVTCKFSNNTVFTNVLSSDSIFSMRIKLGGGAIHGYLMSEISVFNSTFVSNSNVVKTRKLGLYANSTNSKEVHIYSFSTGGAIFTDLCNLTVNRSNFFKNAANTGGAIMTESGCISIVNSVFRKNSGRALLLSNADCSVKVENCVFLQHTMQPLNSDTFFDYLVYTFDNFNDNYRFQDNTKSELRLTHDHIHKLAYSFYSGGVLFVSNSSISFVGTKFIKNTGFMGGAIQSIFSFISISSTKFVKNSALQGGALNILRSNAVIKDCTFINNSLTYKYNNNKGNEGFTTSLKCTRSSMTKSPTIMYYTAPVVQEGADVHVSKSSWTAISNTSFTSNAAHRSSLSISFSNVNVNNIIFVNNTNNLTVYDYLCIYFQYSVVNITNSLFINSKVMNTWSSSVMLSIMSDIRIKNCTFKNNVFTMHQSDHSIIKYNTITVFNSDFIIEKSRFIENSGALLVIDLYHGNCSFGLKITAGEVCKRSNITIERCIFVNNSAIGHNPTIFIFSTNLVIKGYVIIQNGSGSIVDAIQAINSTVLVSGNVTISNNINGSAFLFISTAVAITGNLNISNNLLQSQSFFSGNQAYPITGMITGYQSEITFTKTSICTFSNIECYNCSGSAISFKEGKVYMYGDVTITHNKAETGGGIFAYLSEVNIHGNIDIVDNIAVDKGGGIHAVGSVVRLIQGSLKLNRNDARKGGGICLELSTKIYIIKNNPECQNVSSVYSIVIESYSYSPITNQACNNDSHNWLKLEFTNNYADYGGAIYVNDEANLDTCTAQFTDLETSQCFFQAVLADIIYVFDVKYNTLNTYFTNNTARVAGHTIFGGLLDRCRVHPSSEIFKRYEGPPINALSYISDFNVTNIDKEMLSLEISSLPVRVCFCIRDQPDCSYQHPTVRVKKGETFSVSVVAVDQVNDTIPHTTIYSSTQFSESALSVGQAIQITGESCTNLNYSIASNKTYERLTLYAEGPCRDLGISATHISIKFLKCPIGFTDSLTTCDCDPQIYPSFVSDCSINSEALLTKDNVWISYVNITDPEGIEKHSTNKHTQGFVTYLHCPFDFCKPSAERGWINFNLPNAADEQCAFNRSGKLCGSCHEGLSITLGSSQCMPCSNHWLSLLALFAVAGIVLVTFLLVWRLTVDEGTISGFVFYANVIASSQAIFVPTARTNVLTIFIAWLNLDFGFKTCFFDGMDGYTKIWLQFAFPLYIISLVIVIIVACHYSTKISRIFLAKNSVATLATLILLSYTKLLRTIIIILSYAALEYPDGSHEKVLLFDANVKYLSRKHIPLLIAGVLVLVVGIPYTLILFLWQWLQCYPKVSKLRWLKYTELHSVMEVYHASYSPHYRFWTGFLLLARVLLYLVNALNVQHDPKIDLFSVICVVTFILIVSTSNPTGGVHVKRCKNTDDNDNRHSKVKNNWPLNILENSFYFNLILLSAATFYVRETGGDQLAVAYTSISIVLITFLGVSLYHTYEYIIKGVLWKIKEMYVFRNIMHQHGDSLEELPIINLSDDEECSVTEIEGIPTAHDTDGNIIEHEDNGSASPQIQEMSQEIQNEINKDILHQPSSQPGNSKECDKTQETEVVTDSSYKTSQALIEQVEFELNDLLEAGEYHHQDI